MSKFKDSEYFKSGKSLENLKKATISSGLKLKELKKDRILEYNNNPKLCKECKSALPYEKRNNKFCSNSCSAIFNNLKRENMTETTKKNISISLSGKKKSQEFCKKISDSGFKRFENENEKHKISKSLKEFWKDNDFAKENLISKITGRIVSKETREKQSEIASNRIKNGTFKPQLTSIKCLYKFKNKEIRCDSKVEYSCLNYFENNFEILDIERCDFLIDFDYDGIIKKYNPDFKITTINDVYIVECKTILSSKELVRKWSYYYDTIEYKKIVLDKYCKENNFLSFNYNKDMNSVFYKNCKPQLIN